MDASEIAFLQKKAAGERSVLVRILRNLGLLAMIMCFGGMIMETLRLERLAPTDRAIEMQHDPYAILGYAVALAVLLLAIASGGFIYYRRVLWKIQKDLKRNLKSVEQTTIARKQFVSVNNSRHFYLDSGRQLSIEVSEEDFERFNEGDEINIEYSTYSNIYFGYF